MALPTNTLATYEAIGNREDLADVIYRIDPTETPFLSGIEKAKATAVKHEWQTQALATAQTTNAVLEGDDVTADATTVTVRLSNVAQISRKVPQVTGTQQAIDHAGRGNEMAYQEMLKGLELKRDMEGSIIASTWGSTVGSDSAVRHLGSVLCLGSAAIPAFRPAPPLALTRPATTALAFAPTAPSGLSPKLS